MIDRLIHWLVRRRVRYIAQQIEWSQDDAMAVRHFLESQSGKKLVLCLQKLANQRNASAVLAATPQACGQAVGYAMVFQDLQALSGACSVAEDEAGESDAFSHLRP